MFRMRLRLRLVNPERVRSGFVQSSLNCATPHDHFVNAKALRPSTPARSGADNESYLSLSFAPTHTRPSALTVCGLSSSILVFLALLECERGMGFQVGEVCCTGELLLAL